MTIAAALIFLVLGSIVGTYFQVRSLREDVDRQTEVLLMILAAVDDKSDPADG